MRFEYLTILVYNARGTSAEAEKSRILCGLCKNGNLQFSKKLALTVFDKKLEEYFTDSVLVPVPRSTPLVQGALFPTKIIADTFVAKGLGNHVVNCLIRLYAIPKSSSAYTADTRNSLKTNLDSLSVQTQTFDEKNIIIFDDILTLGRTTMAAALKIAEAYPDKNIKIFAAFRTRGTDRNQFKDIKRDTMTLNSEGDDVVMPD